LSAPCGQREQRVLCYEVGSEFPKELEGAWIEEQRQCGFIGPNDLVVGLRSFSEPDLPPTANWSKTGER
jgi:hypothetical protein